MAKAEKTPSPVFITQPASQRPFLSIFPPGQMLMIVAVSDKQKEEILRTLLKEPKIQLKNEKGE